MNAGASTHSVVAEQWCAPASGRRQSASRRGSLGKISKDCPRWSRQYLRRLFDDVEFSYLVVVAAELGVADLLAPGYGRSPASLRPRVPMPSRFTSSCAARRMAAAEPVRLAASNP
jgi:hypothetical protein